MSKVLAIQMCHTSKGRMVPEFSNANGQRVWPGDIEDLPDEEIQAFGEKHLKPVAASEKIRRYDIDVLRKPGKPGKTMTTKSKKAKTTKGDK